MQKVLPHFPVNQLEVINYAINSFLVHNFTLYLEALGNTRSASQTFLTVPHKSCILSHSEGLFFFAESAVLPEKELQTQFAILIRISLSALLLTII